MSPVDIFHLLGSQQDYSIIISMKNIFGNFFTFSTASGQPGLLISLINIMHRAVFHLAGRQQGLSIIIIGEK